MKSTFYFLLIFSVIPIFASAQSLRHFNFEFQFIKNNYNSNTELFAKDMVVDPPVAFKIKFTKQEMKKVYQKIQEIGFNNYPEVYRYENADSTNKMTGRKQPCFGYSMSVSSKNYQKKVSWSDCITGNHSKNNQYEKLMELYKLIYRIISQKEEYKNSPPVRAGYL